MRKQLGTLVRYEQTVELERVEWPARPCLEGLSVPGKKQKPITAVETVVKDVGPRRYCLQRHPT